jgi:hypothetical protein
MEPILILASILLSFAGIVSYIIAWLKAGTAFSGRDFAKGAITGVLAGVALAIANAMNIVQAVDDTAKFILIGSLFLSVVGVDQLRGNEGARLKKEEQPS